MDRQRDMYWPKSMVHTLGENVELVQSQTQVTQMSVAQTFDNNTRVYVVETSISNHTESQTLSGIKHGAKTCMKLPCTQTYTSPLPERWNIHVASESALT